MATLSADTRTVKTPRHAAAEYSTVREHEVGEILWGLSRIAIGFVFLWAFLDKLFGLGRSTPSAKSWINGGSPAAGYLSNVKGPLKGFFNGMAGHAWADWLFMIGLAGLGIALMLGIGMWIAAATGTVLLVLMWLSALPISSNPFLDEHLIYALVILAVAFSGEGLRYGLGHWWRRLPIVQRLPWLK